MKWLGLTRKLWFVISTINILCGMVRTYLYILGTEDKSRFKELSTSCTSCLIT
jgi:hypothetical protein